jgi:tetratricopeptide (TPR) repeat protein
MIRDDNLRKVLLSRKVLTPEQVEAAVRKQKEEIQKGQTQRLLGDILVEAGLLSADRLREIVDQAPSLLLEERAAQDFPPDVARAAASPANDLGKYVKLGILGRGGMGVVVKAWDRQLRRHVALKFLETTSAEDLKRFQREAQLAASLRHPNIVQVHEMGSIRGRAFIAMDYVRGSSMEKLGGKLAPKRVLEIMSPICDALAAAHSREIVHRDIKPHNIMIDLAAGSDTRNGRFHPFIMDFGLAKVVSVDSSLSMSGVIMGTPHYMSPEQASGELGRVDHRTDIYSLGATMYWLLAGRPPIDGETPLQIVLRLQTEEPPPLRRENPRVPAEVETIVMKCLAKDRNQRYQSAAELKEDIDLYLADQPIKARPPSLTYLLKHKIRRHKAWVIAGSVFFVLLAAITAGFVQRLRVAPQAAVESAKREQALALYNKARVQVDKSRTERSSLARVERRERLATAIADLDQAIRLDPDDANFYFYRAEAKYLLWHGKSSLADYDKALTLDPRLGEAIYRRIMVNVLQIHDGYDIAIGMTMGRPRLLLIPFSSSIDPAAIRSDAERLRVLGDQPAKVRCVEGVLLFHENKLEDATNAFADSERIESFADPIALKAFVRLQTENGGGYQAAIDDLNRAITLDPNMPLFYVLRAVAHANAPPEPRRPRDDSTDSLDKAMEDVEQAIEITPDAADLYVIQGYIALMQHDVERALQAAGKAGELEPENPRVAMIDAMISWTRGDRTAALATLDAAIQRSESYAPLYYLKGLFFVGARDLTRADQAFNDYLARIPEAQKQPTRDYYDRAKAIGILLDDIGKWVNPEASLAAARQCVKEGRADEAEAEYRRLVRSLGLSPKSRQSIGEPKQKEMLIEANLYLAAAAAKRRERREQPNVTHHLRAAARAGYTDFDRLFEREEWKDLAGDPTVMAAVRRAVDEAKSGKEAPSGRPGLPRKRPEDRDR